MKRNQQQLQRWQTSLNSLSFICWAVESIFFREGIDISGKWHLFSMVFNGSGSIVRNQNKSWKFRNYEILRKSEEIKRNFFNKKASDIHKYFPGNWTRPNDEVPYIRDGLVHCLNQVNFMVQFGLLERQAGSWYSLWKLAQESRFSTRDSES